MVQFFIFLELPSRQFECLLQLKGKNKFFNGRVLKWYTQPSNDAYVQFSYITYITHAVLKWGV